MRLRPGDAFRIASGGGGGFGDPTARPVGNVAEDVVEGYVSRQAAAALYGVEVDEHGQANEASRRTGARD